MVCRQKCRQTMTLLILAEDRMKCYIFPDISRGICVLGKKQGIFIFGDLVYTDSRFAYYPSIDQEAYLDSLEKVAALPVKKVFLGHYSLDIKPEILIRMWEAFKNLKVDEKLHHGSGTFDYGDWGGGL